MMCSPCRSGSVKRLHEMNLNGVRCWLSSVVVNSSVSVLESSSVQAMRTALVMSGFLLPIRIRLGLR